MTRTHAISLALVLFAVGRWASLALALPPGDLDLSFAGTGRVTTDFAGNDVASAVIVQADGKIVAGGTRELANNVDFALARYTADGAPDLAFGNSGRVTTDFSAADDQLIGLLQQPDGKLVAVGGDLFHFSLARYLSDGGLDPSFGFGGRVSTSCGYSCTAFAAVQQSDGYIVVAGRRRGPVAGNEDFLLVRYRFDGSLDSSFGTGGIVQTDFPSGRQDAAQALRLQADGKLVAGGVAVNTSGGTDVALARYNTDGSLDTSFGSDGLVVEHVGDRNQVFDLRVQEDGKIVAAGDSHLLRYLPDGTLDPTFGSGGIVNEGGGFTTRIVIEPSGDVIAAIELSDSFEIRRFRSDGSPDTTFGTRGRVVPGLFGSFLNSTPRVDLALAPDGRILIAGIRLPQGDFAVARYGGGHILRCAPSPLLGCKAPTAVGRSQLLLDRRHDDRKLKWRWQHGDATTLADFGDPIATDDYAFCAYDESAGLPVLAFETLAPGAGLCAAAPCWRAQGDSQFLYGDKEEATPLGLTALTLKHWHAGRARVGVDAAGANLSSLPLPAPLPLRVQLQATTGSCWEAVFSIAGATHPGYTEIFKGKSD